MTQYGNPNFLPREGFAFSCSRMNHFCHCSCVCKFYEQFQYGCAQKYFDDVERQKKAELNFI